MHLHRLGVEVWDRLLSDMPPRVLRPQEDTSLNVNNTLLIPSTRLLPIFYCVYPTRNRSRQSPAFHERSRSWHLLRRQAYEDEARAACSYCSLAHPMHTYVNMCSLSTWKTDFSLSSQRMNRRSVESCRSFSLMCAHNALTTCGRESCVSPVKAASASLLSARRQSPPT